MITNPSSLIALPLLIACCDNRKLTNITDYKFLFFLRCLLVKRENLSLRSDISEKNNFFFCFWAAKKRKREKRHFCLADIRFLLLFLTWPTKLKTKSLRTKKDKNGTECSWRWCRRWPGCISNWQSVWCFGLANVFYENNRALNNTIFAWNFHF